MEFERRIKLNQELAERQQEKDRIDEEMYRRQMRDEEAKRQADLKNAAEEKVKEAQEALLADTRYREIIQLIDSPDIQEALTVLWNRHHFYRVLKSPGSLFKKAKEEHIRIYEAPQIRRAYPKMTKATVFGQLKFENRIGLHGRILSRSIIQKTHDVANEIDESIKQALFIGGTVGWVANPNWEGGYYEVIDEWPTTTDDGLTGPQTSGEWRAHKEPIGLSFRVYMQPQRGEVAITVAECLHHPNAEKTVRAHPDFYDMESFLNYLASKITSQKNTQADFDSLNHLWDANLPHITK